MNGWLEPTGRYADPIPIPHHYLNYLQENLNLTPNAVLSSRAVFTNPAHVRAGSVSKTPATEPAVTNPAVNRAYIEQVRLLVIGMEQRLQARERKLLNNIEQAEAEAAKFEDLRKQILT